jgi:hypothetical protein
MAGDNTTTLGLVLRINIIFSQETILENADSRALLCVKAEAQFCHLVVPFFFALMAVVLVGKQDSFLGKVVLLVGGRCFLGQLLQRSLLNCVATWASERSSSCTSGSPHV